MKDITKRTLSVIIILSILSVSFFVYAEERGEPTLYYNRRMDCCGELTQGDNIIKGGWSGYYVFKSTSDDNFIVSGEFSKILVAVNPQYDEFDNEYQLNDNYIFGSPDEFRGDAVFVETDDDCALLVHLKKETDYYFAFDNENESETEDPICRLNIKSVGNIASSSLKYPLTNQIPETYVYTDNATYTGSFSYMSDPLFRALGYSSPGHIFVDCEWNWREIRHNELTLTFENGESLISSNEVFEGKFNDDSKTVFTFSLFDGGSFSAPVRNVDFTDIKDEVAKIETDPGFAPACLLSFPATTPIYPLTQIRGVSSPEYVRITMKDGTEYVFDLIFEHNNYNRYYEVASVGEMFRYKDQMHILYLAYKREGAKTTFNAWIDYPYCPPDPEKCACLIMEAESYGNFDIYNTLWYTNQRILSPYRNYGNLFDLFSDLGIIIKSWFEFNECIKYSLR